MKTFRIIIDNKESGTFYIFKTFLNRIEVDHGTVKSIMMLDNDDDSFEWKRSFYDYESLKYENSFTDMTECTSWAMKTISSVMSVCADTMKYIVRNGICNSSCPHIVHNSCDRGHKTKQEG